MARCPSARSCRQPRRKGNSGPAKCRDGIGPEGAWLVVEVVHGDPGNSPGLGRCPQRQSHRFARAGRASDDGQRAPLRALGDELGNPRPRHRPVRHTWRGDLGCQNGDFSGNCRPSGGSRRLPGNIGRHRDPSFPASGLMAAGHGRPHVAIPPRPAAVQGVSPPSTTKRQPARLNIMPSALKIPLARISGFSAAQARATRERPHRASRPRGCIPGDRLAARQPSSNM